MTKLPILMVFMMIIASSLAGCSFKQYFVESQPTDPSKNVVDTMSSKNEKKSVSVVANPSAIPVLVNKVNKLPDSYKPTDLVDPNIPFIFKAKVEKRRMRSSAARAIEKLFAGAKQDGVRLLGVSAYRSHEAQTALFNHYVSMD